VSGNACVCSAICGGGITGYPATIGVVASVCTVGHGVSQYAWADMSKGADDGGGVLGAQGVCCCLFGGVNTSFARGGAFAFTIVLGGTIAACSLICTLGFFAGGGFTFCRVIEDSTTGIKGAFVLTQGEVVVGWPCVLGGGLKATVVDANDGEAIVCVGDDDAGGVSS